MKRKDQGIVKGSANFVENIWGTAFFNHRLPLKMSETSDQGIPVVKGFANYITKFIQMTNAIHLIEKNNNIQWIPFKFRL